MRRLLPIAFVLVGCAHAPDVHDAIDGGQIVLGFIREDARPLEQVNHVATDAAIARCKGETTPEIRKACLERIGFGPADLEQYEKALEDVAAAYDAIAKSLDALERAWPVLERLKSRAEALEK